MRTKWIHTIIVLAFGLFAVSCSNHIDESGASGKTRKVVFRLAVNDAVGGRAAWSTNNSSEHGTAMENRIDFNSLRLVICAVDNNGALTKVGETNDLSYWSINGGATTTGDPIEYQLVGDISDIELIETHSYRFFIYANFKAHHSNLYQFDWEDVNGDDGYIPMWGVVTHSVTAAELQDLGTIHLLRAAAKVVVAFDASFPTGYTVNSVTIKNYNETGNNLPSGWNTCENTTELDMEDCINVTGNHVHETLPFIHNTDGTYTLYLPEYSNVSHASDKSVVQVTLNNRSYDIHFCDYDNAGIPNLTNGYNIVRNHIYRFNIKGIAAGGLKLSLEVADWTKGSVPTLGTLAYPTYVNPLLPSQNYDVNNEINIQPTMKKVGNETKSFEAWFHFISANIIPTNTDYVWKPTILDKTPNEYLIEVFKDGNTLVYSSNNESSNQDLLTDYVGWFKIKVTPLETILVNEIFTLGISCSIHPSGFPSEDFFLFINGENDDIAWPNSGNDRKFIEITQVVE